MAKTLLLPEDAILAVLHRAGDISLENDQRLIDVFAEAAKDCPDLFSGLEKHPQYHDSLLTNQLAAFVVGGALQSELSTRNLRAASIVLGEYGSRIYFAFDNGQREALDRIATKVQAVFS